MSCRLEIVDESGIDLPLPPGRLQRLLDLTCQAHKLASCELCLLLTDDAGSATLHLQHFDDPDETDVMSFPDSEPDAAPDAAAAAEGPRLGDLAVNLARACRLGPRHHPDSQTPAADELTLYVLHGLLHLLGYDDREPEAQRQMWQEQRRLLALVGITLSPEPEA